MFNLFDILQSQAGPGMQSIGQQFGLTPEQSRSAMNALLPALAAGLQRSATSDPMGFGRMLGMAGANPFLGAQPQTPAPAQPDFLGQLFGSPMLSQAVLQQASSASGIGQQALRQMLPMMAGMVVAGIVHVMINQPPPQPAPAPSRRQPPPPPSTPEPGGFPVASFWSDWIDQFIAPPQPEGSGPTAHAQEPREPSPPKAPAPSPKPAKAEPKHAEGGEPSEAEEAPFEAFQQIFETGVQVQEQNAKAMQEIFDAFWSKPQETPPSAERDAVSEAATPTTADRRTSDEGKSGPEPAGKRPSALRKAK